VTDQEKREALLKEKESILKEIEDLEKRRVELHDEVAPAKAELSDIIQRSRSKFYRTNELRCATLNRQVSYVDNELRVINTRTNQIQRRLGEVKAEIRSMPKPLNPELEAKERLLKRTKLGIFHDVCQDTLPRDQFLRIWQVVEGRVRLMGVKLEDDVQPDFNK
jgi:hypothetical protein